MPRFTTQHVQTPDEWASDLRRMAAAAARLAMNGAKYGEEERRDVAAEIVGAVLETAATGGPLKPRCGECGGPAERSIPVMDDYGTACPVPRCFAHSRRPDARTLVGTTAPLPPFSHLYRDAMNARQSIDRRTARDAADAAQRAANDAFTPHVVGESEDVRATPAAARRLALDMLRDWGVLNGGDVVRRDARLSLPAMHAHGTPRDVLRYIDRAAAILDGPAWPVAWRPFLADATPLSAPRAESPSGALWSAAYAAARAAAGLDAESIARELDITYGTLRNHLSAAAAKLPSAAHLGVNAHALALSIPTPHDARPLTESLLGKDGTSGARDDWRTTPSDAAAVTLRTGTPAADITPPSWTVALPAPTARRLSHAVTVKRARMAAKDDAQRAADRAAAGIPATVR